MQSHDVNEWLRGGHDPGDSEGGEASPSGAAWWQDGPPDVRGPRRLWALAALVWVCLAGILLARCAPGPPVRGATAVAGAASVPVQATTAPPPSDAAREEPTAKEWTAPEAAVAPASGTSASAAAPAAPPPGVDPALGTLAALTVQDVMTGPDPTGDRQRYVDLALPESVDWVGEAAVVRVAAVVLEGAQGRWDAPRRARYAVPLRPDAGGPTLLGRPWALPGSAPQTEPPAGEWTAVRDQTLTAAVTAALHDADYRGVDVRTLGRDPRLPGVLQAVLTATAPGEDRADEHRVWLRDDPEPTLLGGARPSAGPPPPTGPPETSTAASPMSPGGGS